MAKIFTAVTSHKWRTCRDIFKAGANSPGSAVANGHDVLTFAKNAPGSEPSIISDFCAPKGSGAGALSLVLIGFGDGVSGAGNAKFDITPRVNGVALGVVSGVIAVLATDSTTKASVTIEGLTSVQYTEGDLLQFEVTRADNADGGDTYAGFFQLAVIEYFTENIAL